MKNFITKIRHSLSLRISLWILFIAVLIFVVSLGFLYIRTRNYIRQDAFERAEKVLNNTTLGVTQILNEVEIATTNTDWLVRSHLQPDSVTVYSQRILQQNPNFFGCSIAFEPYYFEQQGKFFSIYSGRENGMIETEQEGSESYNYFMKDWYQIPLKNMKECWIEPYYDFYLDTVEVKEMITSYSKPIIDKSGRAIGVVSTDLSLHWLSETVTAKKPSPRSYCVMLGKGGNYLVYPDTAQLVTHSIFTGADPVEDADRIRLGRDMVAGKEGMRHIPINGEECYVFFRPVPRTGWSLAIVCPESEIFRGYNRLFYIVLGIIVIGLLLLLVVCRQIVNSAIVPVNQLARKARHLAAGNFDERMPHSDRIDAVGQLQNSFATMQQSISDHINGIQRMNVEIEQRNEELVKANELAREADLKRTAFMQDITHQVRTPLNIITGFSQVLREGSEFVSEEEMETIIDAMQENSKNITYIINMLITASNLETQTGFEQTDEILCNDFCREVLGLVKPKHPDTVEMKVDTAVPDTCSIVSNKDILQKVLKEMLENANKFTQQGYISIGCKQPDTGILQFVVTDTGIGIPESEKDRIFAQFTKLDDFTEGIGLGLTLCKRISLMLGGDLELDTSYTTGSRFVLTLPVRK
ncbi:MAG: HAMP domain-containing protein [Bacteroidaceae bacterium]|nr:HAMP domain-containing protein [Bacteroidaceae bacterium]